MKILVACEFSGVVRDEFLKLGHDAVSCDLLSTEIPGPHIQGDVLDIINSGEWDLLIAHPPCTHLSSSGARWFSGKQKEQYQAISFFLEIAFCAIPRYCIENPVGIISTHWRRPDQYIQPWEFGHGETKKTCLWLRNLPRLKSTNIVTGRTARVHLEPPGVNRWKNRSRTYPGIALAMAEQWGFLGK